MEDQATLDSVLRKQRVARLATVDQQGRPHMVPIVFAIAQDRLYTPLDRKPKSVAPLQTRRVRNILANPEVQVLVDHYDDDWSQLWFIQMGGRAELLEAGPEYRAAVRLLEDKYPQYAELPLDDRPIIRVEIRRVVRWGG